MCSDARLAEAVQVAHHQRVRLWWPLHATRICRGGYRGDTYALEAFDQVKRHCGCCVSRSRLACWSVLVSCCDHNNAEVMKILLLFMNCDISVRERTGCPTVEHMSMTAHGYRSKRTAKTCGIVVHCMCGQLMSALGAAVKHIHTARVWMVSFCFIHRHLSMHKGGYAEGASGAGVRAPQQLTSPRTR